MCKTPTLKFAAAQKKEDLSTKKKKKKKKKKTKKTTEKKFHKSSSKHLDTLIFNKELQVETHAKGVRKNKPIQIYPKKTHSPLVGARASLFDAWLRLCSHHHRSAWAREMLAQTSQISADQA